MNSGILSDVRITADARSNALIVSAPPENLELLEALIRQLDDLPAAEAQIKVFTIVNGDAKNLSDHAAMRCSHCKRRRRPAATADDADDGLGRREHAGAVAIRRRHAHQQHYRLRVEGRSGRGRGDPHAAGRQRAEPQERGDPPEELRRPPRWRTTINNFLTSERQIEQQFPA